MTGISDSETIQFIYPPNMPGFLLERCIQPQLYNLFHVRHRNEPSGQTEHIGIVVLAGKFDDFIGAAAEPAIDVDYPADDSRAVKYRTADTL